MNKNNMRVLKILCIISFLISLYFVFSTYAKYVEEKETNYEIGMKRWLIKLNDEEIRGEKTLEEILTPTFVSNDNISENVLVPSSELYFDVVINYDEVDVDFTVEFTIENEDCDLEDLIFFGYREIGNGEYGEMKDLENGKLQVDIILENEETKEKEIRVYYKWNDDSDNAMNNEEDTTFQANNETVQYKAKVVCTQII